MKSSYAEAGNPLESHDHMGLWRDWICLFLVDSEVVVAPQDLWLCWACGKRGRAGGSWYCVRSRSNNAAHWTPRLWRKCHGRGVKTHVTDYPCLLSATTAVFFSHNLSLLERLLTITMTLESASSRFLTLPFSVSEQFRLSTARWAVTSPICPRKLSSSSTVLHSRTTIPHILMLPRVGSQSCARCRISTPVLLMNLRATVSGDISTRFLQAFKNT